MPPEDAMAALRQDNRDLWDAVSGLRKDAAATLASLAEIKALLYERCKERGVQLLDLRRRQEAVEDVQSHLPCDRHDERIKNIERVMWCLGGAVVSIVARLVYLWLSASPHVPSVPGVTQ